MQNHLHNNIAEENHIDTFRKKKPDSPNISHGVSIELSKEAFEAYVDDLLNDVILNFCFQLHPACKVGILRADDDEVVTPETEDIFGQVKGKLKLPKINCPTCPRKIEPCRFAIHFEQCSNGNGRQSCRNASKKPNVEYNFEDSDFEEEDDENESDVSYSSSGRKRPRKKNPKAAARKKLNKDALSENAGSFQVPYDMNRFLAQNCGVKSKHTKKMCMNTLKCSQHTSEQKKEVRMLHGCYNQHQSKAEDVQIDVDTVDEVSGVYMNHQDTSENSTPERMNGYLE